MADEPKIHIDSDWKAAAQAEKQKLAQQEKKPEAGGGRPGPGGLPPANFETLVTTLATQALFSMGGIPDPRTGQRVANLDLARHHIDMLSVIEDKTKGNLSEQEKELLATTIYELRSRYIQLAQSSRGG